MIHLDCIIQFRIRTGCKASNGSAAGVRSLVLGTKIERIKDNQAKKSVRWMPWHQEPMKDVVSCDKPWVAASRHRTMDFRMGQPGQSHVWSPIHEFIVYGREPGELKHLSSRRKRK